MADDAGVGLTPAQQDALATGIAKQELLHTVAVDSPRAILTGGQPGSGKSYIVDSLAVQFERAGGIVTIDPDAIRPQIPYMQERIAAGDLDIPNAAFVDAGTVAYKIIQIAKSERRNLLIDGTLQGTDRAVGLAKELTAAGYSVEMHGMAVYPDLSHARTYSRREAQIAASPTGFGRGVGDEFHDQAVTGYTKTVGVYQADKVVTSLTLYNSGGTKEAECRLVDGQWTPDVAMVKVLENTHQNPSQEVKIATVGAWQQAWDAMKRRDADPADQAKVAQFAEAALKRAQLGPSAPTPQQSAERYDAACQAEAIGVRGRADRIHAALSSRLDAARAAVAEHRPTMPRAPSGPAAWLPGVEKGHAKKFDAWVSERNRLTGIADRIEQRLDRVAEYAEIGTKAKPAPAERLAASNVARRNPELASIATEYTVAQRQAKVAAIVQDRDQQQRQKQSRGR